MRASADAGRGDPARNRGQAEGQARGEADPYGANAPGRHEMEQENLLCRLCGHGIDSFVVCSEDWALSSSRLLDLPSPGGLLLSAPLCRYSAQDPLQAVRRRISECSGRHRARRKSRSAPRRLSQDHLRTKPRSRCEASSGSILEDQTMGMPIDQAVQRLPEPYSSG